VRRLILAAAAAVVLSGCGGHKTPSGTSTKVESKPFGFSVVQDGKTVVSTASDGLWFQLADSGEWRYLNDVISSHGNVYTVGTNDPGRTATVTLTRRASGVRVSVAIHPTSDIGQVYTAYGATTADHFLGSGERTDGADLSGKVVQMKVGIGCTYVSVPYFASTAGWGLRVSGQHVVAFAFPGSPGGGGSCETGDEQPCTFHAETTQVGVCAKGARLVEDIYPGGFSKTLQSYYADAGRPRVPPPSELELIKWRDKVRGPGALYDDVRRLQTARIPIGWVLLDNPWEVCNGDLKFDLNRFPQPAAVVRRVHDYGIRFMLWISPKETCPNGYPAVGLAGPHPRPHHEVLDLQNPAVVAEFKRRLRSLVDLGVDGFKGDRGDEIDFEGRDLSLTNAYPLLFERAAMDVLGPDRGAIFRAGTQGTQAVVPGLWAGDQEGSWAGLAQAIHAGASAGASGFPTWGSDVGGYSSGGGSASLLTAELFVRWAQLGAVSPIMEVGGIGLNATPWKFGGSAMADLRTAAVLHYELFPYLYRLLQRQEQVLHPLGADYPADPGSWSADLELLVGPDLLAAPVTSSTTSPSVYLPPGTWVDLFLGTTVAGGQTLTRLTPIAEFPLYVKAGAVIPFNLRTAHGSWWGVDELTHPGRAGFLATDGAQLHLVGQPHDVQVFVSASHRPVAVTIAGRRVRWTWSDGPLPGVVVRVHGPAVEGRIALAAS